jgi:putative copper resistance protein D
MQSFIEVYGFASVLLRGLILTTQSLSFGGVVFLALVALPLAPTLGAVGSQIACRVMRLLFWSAFALAALEAFNIAALCAMLTSAFQMSAREALSAEAVVSDFLVFAPACVIAMVAYGGGGVPRTKVYLLASAGVALLSAQVATTHSTSRLDSSTTIMAAEFLHMAGAAMWIGGIPYFILALAQTSDGAAWRQIGRRFSLLSMCSVAIIAAGGAVMSVHYIGSFEAFYGTAYGVMVMAKIALFAGLLVLGGMNFLVVERLRRNPGTPILRLRRFAEAEIGVGLTVLFAAASLTSLPPAVDLPRDRVSLAEIAERLTPQWPIRFESPDLAALSVSQLQARVDVASREAIPASRTDASGDILAPTLRKAEDIAWSEYNHHWAGLFVALMGLLALLERNRFFACAARHWPLLFLGLAAFLFLRADEAAWPLGKLGLFESLRDPEIAQHRLFIALIVAFAIFEWRVRLNRISKPWAPLVFPLITGLGAALLLGHSHGLANIKEEFLIEVTHTPLALVGVAAAWSRWLEIRLDDRLGRAVGWIWPVAFLLAGLMLLSYREA